MQKTVNMPEHIVHQVQDMANVSRRSFSGMTVYLIEKALVNIEENDSATIRAMLLSGRSKE